PISVDTTVAFKEILRLIGVFITMSIIVESINYSEKNVSWILKAYIFSYYTISLFLFNNVGTITVTELAWIDRSAETLGLNANTFSYFSFFANISVFYLIE